MFKQLSQQYPQVSTARFHFLATLPRLTCQNPAAVHLCPNTSVKLSQGVSTDHASLLCAQARFLKIDIDEPKVEKTVTESNIGSVVSSWAC